MNLLREEMLKYAGVINEDIKTERILNHFRSFYNGNRNALHLATLGNICYTTKSGSKEKSESGTLKLQISDLPERLKEEGITATGLLGLKEYIKKRLTEEGILNERNLSGFNSIFIEFARKLEGNMQNATDNLSNSKTKSVAK